MIVEWSFMHFSAEYMARKLHGHVSICATLWILECKLRNYTSIYTTVYLARVTLKNLEQSTIAKILKHDVVAIGRKTHWVTHACVDVIHTHVRLFQGIKVRAFWSFTQNFLPFSNHSFLFLLHLSWMRSFPIMSTSFACGLKINPSLLFFLLEVIKYGFLLFVYSCFLLDDGCGPQYCFVSICL